MPEAESKENHCVWDPMPELTINSPYVDSNTFTMGNPMPESTLTLCHNRLYPPIGDFGFSLCTAAEYTEPEFVNLLRSPGIDSQPDGTVRQPIRRTGTSGCIGCRNRSLESIPELGLCPTFLPQHCEKR